MTENYKRLYRSRSDRMFSGLSAGIGQYIGMDPTVVRLLFALGAIFLFPIPIVIYVVMMVIVPEEPLIDTPPVEIIDRAKHPIIKYRRNLHGDWKPIPMQVLCYSPHLDSEMNSGAVVVILALAFIFELNYRRGTRKKGAIAMCRLLASRTDGQVYQYGNLASKCSNATAFSRTSSGRLGNAGGARLIGKNPVG
jgi:phage shock protein C